MGEHDAAWWIISIVGGILLERSWSKWAAKKEAERQRRWARKRSLYSPDLDIDHEDLIEDRLLQDKLI